MKFFRHFFFLLFVVGVFFVGLHSDVYADVTSASVTIVTTAPAVTTSTTGSTTSSTNATVPNPSGDPFIAARPLDSLAPIFIPPSEIQLKSGSYFDLDKLVQFLQLSSSDILIHWYSNEMVKFSFVYGETVQYEIAHFSTILYSTENYVRLIALVPGKSYFGKITITDQSGNSAEMPISFGILHETEVEKEVPKEVVLIETEKIPVPEKKEEDSIIDDVKKVIDELFSPNDDVPDAESDPVSNDTVRLKDQDAETRVKNTSPYGGGLGFDYELAQSIGDRLFPRLVKTYYTQFAVNIVTATAPQIALLKSFVHAVEIPGPQIFIMPSIINKGFSSLGMIISLVHQSLSDEFSVCSLVGVDGLLEVIFHEVFRFSLCK